MSTRTDWGLFDASGKPLAVGDEWHKWDCPGKVWRKDWSEDYETGELIDNGYIADRCPFKYIGPKLEVCSRCGNQFRYP